MPSFPSGLTSAILADGFRETLPDLALRTSMEQGPAKLRRRTTAGVAEMTFSLLLDAAGTQTLDAFYSDDLAGGTLAFDLTHPRTGDTASCRFKKPPRHLSVNGIWFRSSVELEILP